VGKEIALQQFFELGLHMVGGIVLVVAQDAPVFQQRFAVHRA
jgi:hypothetical protein